MLRSEALERLERVTPQKRPGDARRTRFVTTALLGAKGHFDTGVTARIGRAPVVVFRRRRSSTAIDGGPPLKGCLSPQKSNRHAGHQGGRSSRVGDAGICSASERNFGDRAAGDAIVDVLLQEIERRGRHGSEDVCSLTGELVNHPASGQDTGGIDAPGVDACVALDLCHEGPDEANVVDIRDATGAEIPGGPERPHPVEHAHRRGEATGGEQDTEHPPVEMVQAMCLRPEILRECATLARQRLVEAASDRQLQPRDLACTMLAVIVAPMGGGALQIGDGVIVVADRPPTWRWVIWPQKGEYANSTYFLSDEHALDKAEVQVFSDDIQDVALMSDGLEQLAVHFPSRRAHDPFFKSVLGPLHAETGDGESARLSQGLANILASPAVRARTDDDASLIIATRRDRS